MIKYYTIFLGNVMWRDVIDDMNDVEIWAKGGLVWTEKNKARKYLKHLKQYDFETPKKKFHIVRLIQY